MQRRNLLKTGTVAGLCAWLAPTRQAAAATAQNFPFTRTDAEWRRVLTPTQYYILRQDGTERAGGSALTDEKRMGRYECAGCNQRAFSSRAKYDSHTGWPSFWEPLPGAVVTSEDRSLFAVRTAVACSNCGGHLGHVFPDGPPPTGLRYCMNGAALAFVPGAA